MAYARKQIGNGVWLVAAVALFAATLVACDSPEPEITVTGTHPTLAIGTTHTCGLRENGQAVCWGSRPWDKLYTPSDSFVAISAGHDYTCGLRDDGIAMCWRNYEDGRASPLRDEGFLERYRDKYGSIDDGRASPLKDERLAAISVGYWHGCGLRADDTAVCWEDEAISPGGKFITISAGWSHTCGLREDGAAVCWGGNEYGRASPPRDERLAAISVGYWHGCGLRADGTAVCWGDNEYGQINPLGVASDVRAQSHRSWWRWWDNEYGEVSPAVGKFTAISAGAWHTCGLREDGVAVCWGANSSGRVNAPVGYSFLLVSAGERHSCGLIQDGTAVCWGANSFDRAFPAGPGGTYLIPGNP